MLSKQQVESKISEIIREFPKSGFDAEYKDEDWYKALDWILVIGVVLNIIKMLYECNMESDQIAAVPFNPTRWQKVLIAREFAKQFGLRYWGKRGFDSFRTDVLKYTAVTIPLSMYEDIIVAYNEQTKLG